MAYPSPITRWLVANRQVFDPKIRDFDWSDKWSTPIFDFRVQISVNGTIHIGRGTDQIDLLALEKACAEAIERAVCSQLQISTRGVAAHPDAKQALINSRQEALERAIFEWHLNGSIPFKQIEKSNWMKQGQSLPIRRDRLVISILESAADFNQAVTICKMSEDDQNFLGLALDSNPSHRLEKAMIEAARNLFAYRENPKQFVESVNNDPDMWCADSRFISKLDSLFGSASLGLEKLPNLKLATSLIDVADLGPFSDAPLSLARTTVESQ